LRIFSDWLFEHDPNVIAFRQINRRHIEAFKSWLATRENQRGHPLKKFTVYYRLSMLRVVNDSSSGTIPTHRLGTRSCGPISPRLMTRCRAARLLFRPRITTIFDSSVAGTWHGNHLDMRQNYL